LTTLLNIISYSSHTLFRFSLDDGRSSKIEDFYASNRADLAVISSLIQFHCRQTCMALNNGSNVLCEKPVAATVQEVQEMIETRDRTKLIVAVGFQWSYDPAAQSLKKEISKELYQSAIPVEIIAELYRANSLETLILVV
jgi:predicted dehydrogenase